MHEQNERVRKSNLYYDLFFERGIVVKSGAVILNFADPERDVVLNLHDN